MRKLSRRTLLGAPTFRIDPPRLRTLANPDEERHATWFELYFDLIFAVAVAQLANALSRNPTGPAFGRFVGLFVVIAWAWAGFVFYANRFDTDDLIYRLVKSCAMLAIAAIAVNLGRVMAGHGGTVGFALGYVIVRSLLVALYVRARMHVHGGGRRLSDVYIACFSFTTGIWLVSIFVPGPFRYVLWGVALAIDLAVPPRAWRQLPGAPIVVSHLTDRFGTFFIIVLGESAAGVVSGVAGFEFSVESWIVASACFLIALCMWWIYFDLADTSVLGRGVLGVIYIYAHLPLLAGVAMFGAGTKLAITHAADPALDAAARWALGAGIAAFALSLALLHMGAEWASLRDRTFIGRIVLAAFAIGLAGAGVSLAPLAFVLLLVAGVLGQLMLEAFTFPVGAASIWEPPEPAERAAAASAPDA